MDEQRENMQNGMIENETTGEQKPDGGKERRRRGNGEPASFLESAEHWSSERLAFI